MAVGREKFEFLEGVVKVTKHQSGSQYITLTMTSGFFKKLKSLCLLYSVEKHTDMKATAEQMHDKLRNMGIFLIRI